MKLSRKGCGGGCAVPVKTTRKSLASSNIIFHANSIRCAGSYAAHYSAKYTKIGDSDSQLTGGETVGKLSQSEMDVRVSSVNQRWIFW